MLNAPVMEANDAVSGSMAECYVTIDGNRYNMKQSLSGNSPGGNHPAQGGESCL